MNDLKPASKATGPTYDPTSMSMKHDSIFASVAPGVVSSGELAHKWSGGGTDHTDKKAPPENLHGD